MASANPLHLYLERYALISLEKQEKFGSLISEPMHELDLDAGTIRFGGLEIPMQIIGTESDNTLTWLWAWADEHTELPASLLQSAIQLRNWGADQGIEEFVIPSVDLVRAEGLAISLIAAEACGASCYYQDSYEGGAVYILLFDKTIDNQPPFNRARLLLRLSDLFSRYDLNHRNTLLSYLTMKGLSPVAERNLINCELESGERLIAEFNNAERLTVINGSAFEQ